VLGGAFLLTHAAAGTACDELVGRLIDKAIRSSVEALDLRRTRQGGIRQLEN
jgi:hypothetical protein